MSSAAPLRLTAARPAALAQTAPEVAVILPVWRPDPAFLAEQLASIAAQSLPPVLVVAVVADRVSAPLLRRLAHAVGLFPTVIDPGIDLDTPRAVEAGLVAALAATGPRTLYALADQDDIWHPERLARGAAVLEGGAALAHSDARIVDAQGRVLHRSLWAHEARLPRPGLRDLLRRNSVTGMTATFTRALAEQALPFPAQDGVHFYHDLWLALLAAAGTGIARIPLPLVDYRQHGANAHGALPQRRGLRIALPSRAALRAEAGGYALARYLAHAVADRKAQPLPALAPYLSGARGVLPLVGDALRLALRGRLRLARTAAGHAALHLGRSLWALREGLTDGRRAALDRLDARLWRLAPGVPPPQAPAAPGAPVPAAALQDARLRPSFATASTAERPRLHVLVPTVNPTETFAGATTAIDLAAGLAARGVAVSLVATDSPILSPAATLQALRRRLDHDPRAAGRLALVCGRRGGALPVHPGDRFLATAWWTAHVAHGLTTRPGARAAPFHYLIQDDEPQFYPWGDAHAAAEASYRLPHVPLFNSLPLQRHFAAQGRVRPGGQVFHPDVALDRFLAAPRRTQPGRRRIAVYGRPEVPRNLFPLAVAALQAFLAQRAVPPDRVDLVSVGLPHPDVDLGGGHVLRSRGKLPMADYPAYLGSVDVGLALMLSPHPGHVPLEMAAAGVRVVTNRFGPKDLSTLSGAILSPAPDAAALAAALSRAWDMPPVTLAERHLDLTRLGDAPAAVIDRLAADLLAAGLG